MGQERPIRRSESGREPAKPFDPTATAILQIHPRPDLILRPEDARTIQVEVVGGPMDGQKRRIHDPVFTIGRGRKNDLVLALDLMVSMSHARIVREGQAYWLEDLGSRNGTFVGDRKVEDRIPIEPGTLFVAGQTCLEFTPW